MTRILTSAAAAIVAATLFSASAGFAQPVGYYAATPATAPAKDTIITDGTLWKCGNGVCVANKAPERDLIVCQLVASNVGQLTSFTVSGTALPAATLAKCNTKARS
ncbi:CC_3452 family protein [Sphingomonas sp. GlSt437]|uniref:CC_3452 family protein n=1 Tax=Sphingomonas sp. GlSt437 TaxID=3389970 RepID=UPI003A88D8E9